MRTPDQKDGHETLANSTQRGGESNQDDERIKGT